MRRYKHGTALTAKAYPVDLAHSLGPLTHIGDSLPYAAAVAAA